MDVIKWVIWNYPAASVLILVAVNAVVWGIPVSKLCKQFHERKLIEVHDFSLRRSPSRRASHSASSVGR